MSSHIEQKARFDFIRYAQVWEDADILLTYGVRDGDPEEQTQAMIDQPLFQALKVAQSGHIFALSNVIPSSYGAAILFVDSVEMIVNEVTGATAATPSA